MFFALRKCIEEARKDAGDISYFDFSKYLMQLPLIAQLTLSSFKDFLVSFFILIILQ